MKATFCKTKEGNGFKIVIADLWLYTSEKFLKKVVDGEARTCQFRTIKDED